MDIAIDMYYGSIESQRVVHDMAEIIGRDILTEEGVGHAVGNLLKGHVGNAVKELLREGFDALGHIEATVCGKATHHRLAERRKRCLLIGPIVFHFVLFTLILSTPAKLAQGE